MEFLVVRAVGDGLKRKLWMEETAEAFRSGRVGNLVECKVELGSWFCGLTWDDDDGWGELEVYDGSESCCEKKPWSGEGRE